MMLMTLDSPLNKAGLLRLYIRSAKVCRQREAYRVNVELRHVFCDGGRVCSSR